MKKIVFLLITVFCMSCMVACGSETTQDTESGSHKEVQSGSVNEPVVTAEATVEATPAPTEVPVEEATPAPTEEPSVVYEGIDMESTLPGQDWLETFIGVIDEPKVVVFSDITGKKVIVEQNAEVTFNLDEDAMALFIPEGYTNGNVSTGIYRDSNKISIGAQYYEIFYLDPEKMREEMREITEYCPAFLVMKGDERVILKFQLKIE